MGSQAVLDQIKRLIPPLTGRLHKGQAGRIGVVGGSADYTGAPYFSAISAMRVGADLAHVICEPASGAVIKTYSPDLIVHPIIQDNVTADSLRAQMEGLFKRLHVIVVGPGLGREPGTQSVGRIALEIARASDMPIVIDADGLWLVQNEPHLVQGYRRAVLTPNAVEFQRLCDAMKVPKDSPPEQLASLLSRAFGNVTILQKGASDIVSNGQRTEVVDQQGGLKRVGGQGDILSGCVGTFLAWGKTHEESGNSSVNPDEIPLLAAIGASNVTRTASRNAFQKHGRGVLTSDMIGEIGSAYTSVFGETGEKGFKGNLNGVYDLVWRSWSHYIMSINLVHSVVNGVLRLSLKDGRVCLVHPQPPEDDKEAQALFIHPITLKYLPFWSPDATLDQISARRASRLNDVEKYKDFRVYHLPPHTPKTTGLPNLLGTTGYLNMMPENHSAEAGIIIVPEAHRSGYATEVFFILFEWGFRSKEEGGLGLNRITFTTAAWNQGMRRWLEDALGATQEAAYREAWKRGDEYMDAIGYGVLRREWNGGCRNRLWKRVQTSWQRVTAVIEEKDMEVHE